MNPEELNKQVFGSTINKFKIVIQIFKEIYLNQNFNLLILTMQILTDEICESSISFEDVITVIDTGFVQQKTFDSETNKIIKKNIWITKSCISNRRNK